MLISALLLQTVFGYSQITTILEGINTDLRAINGPNGLLSQYLKNKPPEVSSQLHTALTLNNTNTGLTAPITGIQSTSNFLYAAAQGFAAMNRTIELQRQGTSKTALTQYLRDLKAQQPPIETKPLLVESDTQKAGTPVAGRPPKPFPSPDISISPIGLPTCPGLEIKKDAGGKQEYTSSTGKLTLQIGGKGEKAINNLFEISQIIGNLPRTIHTLKVEGSGNFSLEEFFDRLPNLKNLYLDLINSGFSLINVPLYLPKETKVLAIGDEYRKRLLKDNFLQECLQKFVTSLKCKEFSSMTVYIPLNNGQMGSLDMHGLKGVTLKPLSDLPGTIFN